MPVSDEVALDQHRAKPAEARRLVHADVGLHRHRLISAGLITDALCGEVVQVDQDHRQALQGDLPGLRRWLDQGTTPADQAGEQLGQHGPEPVRRTSPAAGRASVS